MRWVEIDTLLRFPSVEEFLEVQQTGIQQHVRGALKTESVVILSDKARKAAWDHVCAFREEQGGLLLGDVYQHLFDGKQRYVIVVTDAVVGVGGEASSVSISIPPDTWIKAAPLLDAGKIAIGWYHSHPNLGAFFSSTDRTTQKNFYSGDYQVGWVIDWIRKDEAWFIGKDSRQLEQSSILYDLYIPAKQSIIVLPDRSGEADKKVDDDPERGSDLNELEQPSDISQEIQFAGERKNDLVELISTHQELNTEKKPLVITESNNAEEESLKP